MPYNLYIPGWMPEPELKILERLARLIPAGGAMVIALILVMAATSVSGCALTTDAFWGVAWMQKLYSGLAHTLLLMVGAHIAGVILASSGIGEIWSSP